MILDLSPDPDLKELQLPWEAQYWDKSRASRDWSAKAYESFLTFFRPERKPRDIFRSDVAEYKIWCAKKGWNQNRIRVNCDFGSRFFRLLNELELVEKDFNPFYGMAPRRIEVKPR